MLHYQILFNVFSNDTQYDFGDNACLQKIIPLLKTEINIIIESLKNLSTSREFDCYNDLEFVHKLTENLQNKSFQKILASPPIFNDLIIENFLLNVCKMIIKANKYNNVKIILKADQIFTNLLKWASKILNHKNKSIFLLISTIINGKADYYKNSGSWSLKLFPFGEEIFFDANKENWIQNLKIGEFIDCVNCSEEQLSWSKGVVKINNYGVIKIKYLYQDKEKFISDNIFELSEFQSKKEFYQWRENLKERDIVLLNRFDGNWYKAEIHEVIKKQQKNILNEEFKFLKLKLLEIPQEESSARDLILEEDSIIDENKNKINSLIMKESKIPKPKNNEYNKTILPDNLSIQKNSSNEIINDLIKNNQVFNELDLPNENCGIKEISEDDEKILLENEEFYNEFFFELGLKNNSESFEEKNTDYLKINLYSNEIIQPNIYINNSFKESINDNFFLGYATEKKIGILRETCNNNKACKSAYFVKYLNILGREGFNFILQMLNNQPKSLSHDSMIPLMKIMISGCWNFLEDFVILNGQSILNQLEKIFNDDIKNSLRDYNKELIDCYLELYHLMSIRYLQYSEALINYFNLKLEFAILCLKSNYLDKKFYGLKLFDELTGLMKNERIISEADIAEKLKRHEIFYVLIKEHNELVEKGSSIFKMLFKEKKIEKNELEIFWNQILKTDIESQKSLISCARNLISDFSENQIIFFIEKIYENTDVLQNEKIYEFFLSLKKCVENIDKKIISELIYKVFWEFYQRNRKKDLFKTIIRNLISYITENKKTEYLDEIIENVRLNINTTKNLKLILKLIENNKSIKIYLLDLINKQNIIGQILEKIILFLKSKSEEKVNNLTKTEMDDINRIFKYIFVLQKLSDNKIIIDFKDIKNIWEVISSNNFNTDIIFDWLKKFVNKQDISPFVEEYITFFNENLDLFTNQHKFCYLSFFILIFYKINIQKMNYLQQKIYLQPLGIYSFKGKSLNIYILNNNIENLVGFNKIWKLFIEIKDPTILDYLINLLVRIYTKPDHYECDLQTYYEREKLNIFLKLREMLLSKNLSLVQKASGLLFQLILKEEDEGFHQLKSLYSLKNLPLIQIYIEKTYTYQNKTIKSLYVKKNITVSRLRELIGEEVNLEFKRVKILRDNEKGEEISPHKNSLTLEQANISDKTTFFITDYHLPEVKEEKILDETGNNFTEKAKLVFNEVFSIFSYQGKLNKQHFCKLIQTLTNKIYSTNDDMIKEVFDKFDIGSKSYLSEQEFLNYYLNYSIKSELKLEILKKYLRTLGYGRDLKLLKLKKDKTKKMIQDFENSLRYKILKDFEIYQALILVATENNLTSIFKDFLQFLTPSCVLINNLLENPLKVFEEIHSNFYFFFNVVLLNSILFDFKSIKEIMVIGNETIEDKIRKSFFSQIFTTKFLELLILKINDFLAEKNKDYIYSILQFLNVLLKISLDFKIPTFIDDTIELELYVRNYQKIANEQICNKDKKITNINKKEIRPEHRILHQLNSDFSPFKKNIIEVLHSLNCDLIIMVPLNVIEYFIDNFKENYSKKIIETFRYSILILLSIIMISPSTIKKLLSEKDSKFNILLINGLKSNRGLISNQFKNLLGYLIYNIYDKDIKELFLELIINIIKNSGPNDEMHVLINLASLILKDNMKLEKSAENSKFDLTLLFKDFFNRLKDYPSKEIEYDSGEDNTLITYLIFMQRLLEADEAIIKNLTEIEKENMLEYFFKDCLFDINDNCLNLKKIKCKTKKSRNSAFDLLVFITQNNLNLTCLIMENYFSKLVNFIPQINLKDIKNLGQLKETKEFIGIKNPGCVCYMNAMLQQFYCIPSFRYGLLMANDEISPKIIEVNGLKIDDNILHQLQRMFSYLDLSIKTDFNPEMFCFSYKDYSNQPTNMMVQQDAQEFLNMIFDKLERKLTDTPFRLFLRSIFGGKTTNVFTCLNCGFLRSNEEIFYNLSLKVQNLKNVEESFKRFILKETISDYKCDNCKQKCDITKECFLKELPSVLIIHLQKIIFDFEFLMNVKISSKYEFEKTLNLKNYLVDKDNINNLQDQDFEYKLSGVVLHKGNAEYGHYTSLINLNRQDPSRKIKTEDLWMEFDDSNLSNYNMNNFTNDCFGSNMRDYSMSYDTGMEITKSAYILVYDKVKPNDLKFDFSDKKPQRDSLINNLVDKNSYKIENGVLVTKYNNLNKVFPECFKDEIIFDNEKVILESQIFSNRFFWSFLTIISKSGFLENKIKLHQIRDKDLIISEKERSLAKTFLNILPEYLFKVFFYSSNNNNKIYEIIPTLEKSLIILPEEIFNFFYYNIFKNIDRISDYIINSNDLNIRKVFCHFLTTIMNIVIDYYSINLDDNLKTEFDEGSISEKVSYYIKETIKYLLNLIPEKKNSTIFKKYSEYFYTLKIIVSKNAIFNDYLVKNDYLLILHDFYLSQKSDSNENYDQSLIYVLSIISLLLRSKNNQVYKQYFLENISPFKFIQKIISENYRFDNFEVMKEIINYLCFENLSLSYKLTYYCLKNLLIAPDMKSISYLECLHGLLLIQDSLTQKRMVSIIGIPQLIDKKVKINEKTNYVFGFSKENLIISKTINYLSNYGKLKGIVEQIICFKDMNPSGTLITIYFLLSFSEIRFEIFEYLINLPPFSYLYNTIFDWIKDYVTYQTNSLPKTFNAPKPELIFMYFNNIAEKLENFEKKVKNYLVEHKKIQIEEIENSTMFTDPEKNIIFNFHNNYIIGKTNSTELICRKIIYQDDYGQLKLNIHKINLSLMKNKTNGIENCIFTKELLNSNDCIDKSKLSLFLQTFIGKNQKLDCSYILEEENLIDEDLRKIKSKNIVVIKNKDETETNEYMDIDYILRLSVENNTLNNYFLKILIKNTNKETPANFDSEEIVILSEKKNNDTLIQNLCLKDINKSFEGLNISLGYLATMTDSIEYFDLENCTESFDVFDFDKK